MVLDWFDGIIDRWMKDMMFEDGTFSKPAFPPLLLFAVCRGTLLWFLDADDVAVDILDHFFFHPFDDFFVHRFLNILDNNFWW